MFYILIPARKQNLLNAPLRYGGNAGFWAYEKDWYANFPDNGANETSIIDNQQIMQTAKDVNLNTSKFSDCVLSNKFAGAINKVYTGGLALGITGTPTSYIVTPTGSPIAIQGAQSYATLKAAIDAILADQGQNAATASTSTQ